jgi:hypothetical protein
MSSSKYIIAGLGSLIAVFLAWGLFIFITQSLPPGSMSGVVYVLIRLALFGAFVVASGVLILGGVLSIGVSEARIVKDVEKVQNRIEREPEKVKPAWDLAEVILRSYFNRNLIQINYIFALSVIVMLTGFGFIVYGMWLAYQNPDVITTAVLGGIAGVVTEFIGVTFLLIYRSTIEQAVKYVSTLERISSVGMAMQIIDTISAQETTQSQEKITEAKITIATLLLNQSRNDKPGSKAE